MAERMPSFRIEVHDGTVRLVHFFRARLWASAKDPQDMVTLTYRKLIDVAHQTKAEVDAALCTA